VQRGSVQALPLSGQSKFRGTIVFIMAPSYTDPADRASAAPLASGVNLYDRQPIALTRNLDGRPIQSIFRQPFLALSFCEIASLFVVLSAGYIDRPLVGSIFVKDYRNVPDILHCEPPQFSRFELSIA
jgi:hypothetical protein